jgi:CBS domain-containing protein
VAAVSHLKEDTMRVRDIMTTKLVTVNPTTLFKDAVQLLLAEGVSSLAVVDTDDDLIGVVTETDLVTKQAYPHHESPSLDAKPTAASSEYHWTTKAQSRSVGDLMSTDVVTCLPGEDVHAVARRMLRRGVHQLPVVMDRKLVGIVSRQDVLATFDRPDEELESEVRRLIDNTLWISEGHAEISVRDGVVTLDGAVRYPADVAIVSDVVANVRGVVDVINRLTSPRRQIPHHG